MTNLVTRPTNQPASSRFTLEMALWIIVAVVALALRLAHLDAAPLNAREAREAMLAWRAATGQGMPEAGYSPFLFAANALLFWLFGASDALARLWPALFGSVLALTPFLLRQRIGRVGALAAGLYLAISPTALFASRQLDGTVVAAVGGMAFLGGLACFLDTGERLWLTLSAGGLALAVTASPSAYGLLLSLGLAGLILSRLTFHVSRFTLPAPSWYSWPSCWLFRLASAGTRPGWGLRVICCRPGSRALAQCRIRSRRRSPSWLSTSRWLCSLALAGWCGPSGVGDVSARCWDCGRVWAACCWL